MSAAALLHRAAAGTYLILFALLAAWLVWLNPPPKALMSLSALTLLAPLLLPLRGLLSGRRYTVAWSTLFIVLYFVHGISTAAGPVPDRWIGVAEAALSVLYFLFAVGYVRKSRPMQVENDSA